MLSQLGASPAIRLPAECNLTSVAWRLSGPWSPSFSSAARTSPRVPTADSIASKGLDRIGAVALVAVIPEQEQPLHLSLCHDFEARLYGA